MLSPKYYLYYASDPSGQRRINLTNNPRLEALILAENGFSEIDLVQPPQPLWIAEAALARLTSSHSIGSPVQFKKLALRLIAEIFPQKHLRLEYFATAALRLAEFDLPEIAALFWGRSLLGGEVPELLRAGGYEPPWDTEDWLQVLCFNGELHREAAIGIDQLGLAYCRRCGATGGIIESSCIFCGYQHCFTCTNCQEMGVAKSCLPLYSQPFPEDQTDSTTVEVRLEFPLTPAQGRAAEAVTAFLKTGAKEFLVWAVCGAGKTEVSFGAIAQSLAAGGRVLFAIPRREVVLELVPRLQGAFPGVELVALYGGSGERFHDAPLIIATTHQCVRFFQAFDLIILDEADAFPYQGSSWLQHVLHRALKPAGRLVIMTATPDRALIDQAASGRLPSVSIPARHHRQPLVLPELVKVALKVGRAPGVGWVPPLLVQQFLGRVKAESRRALIFMPTIQSLETFSGPILHWAAQQGIRGEYTHSRRDNRQAVKTAILDGELDFLITSTLYERGVTIPKLDVLVLFADYERIFDPRTLVQIAGRVGRIGEPASLVFAAEKITKTMRDALQWLDKMNAEGYHLGYLD